MQRHRESGAFFHARKFFVCTGIGWMWPDAEMVLGYGSIRMAGPAGTTGPIIVYFMHF